MEAIKGLHHITAIASDAQENANFYTRILGQRLIKTTVNFDDPGTYHLYYGDEVGAPGTIMTFFPWKNAHRGKLGNGETSAVAYSIDPVSVGFWRDHLVQKGINLGPIEQRFNSEVISFTDPDGMNLELIAHETSSTIRHWENSPIPEKHVLGGFHGVTLWVAEVDLTAQLLSDIFGYTLEAQEGSRYRFKADSNSIGNYVDIVHRPGQPLGLFGSGSIHHIAFRTVDDIEQSEYQKTLRDAGLYVTPVRDRQYFRSIYFRIPSGILFEIATDEPGFLYDESISELGTHLKLPPWLEPRREEIINPLPFYN